MFRKTNFFVVIMIALTIIGSHNPLAFAGFFDDSIGFDKGPVAAWWVFDTPDYGKFRWCAIAHTHDTYSNCETDQGHHVSEKWENKPDKIYVKGTAKWEGGGYVRFRSTGGQVTLDGENHITLTARTVAGVQVGGFPILKKKGKPGKTKPIYTFEKQKGTVEKIVYEIDPPEAPGAYSINVESGSALGDGFEASNGVYVEISISGNVTGVEITGTAGRTVEWSKGREATSTGILSGSSTWTVGEKNVCLEHLRPCEITDVHDHHWTCPINNNGCGEHLQCQTIVDRYDGPDHDHMLHASCWNVIHGCSETSVRRCTHECQYEPNRYMR